MEIGPHSTVRESPHTAVTTQARQVKRILKESHFKKKKTAPGLTASVTLIVQMSCFAALLTSGYKLLFKSLSESENEVAHSCPTLCDLMDCSLPGSSVHGVFQARVLEWFAISFSRELPIPGIDPRSPEL